MEEIKYIIIEVEEDLDSEFKRRDNKELWFGWNLFLSDTVPKKSQTVYSGDSCITG